MVSCIIWISLILSILSFVLFGISVLFPRTPGAGNFGDAAPQGDLAGWAKIGEAIAKVIDSLSKAGPSTLTLVSSLAFMIIALVAAKS